VSLEPSPPGGRFDHVADVRGPDSGIGGQGPENLNLVEVDQPLDQKNPGPKLRPRQRVRFRPPQGLEGQEPEFFEGPAGYRNVEKGYGTENQPDTGSPSSIMLATWKRRRTLVEETMPNAVKEGEPQEEGQTTTGNPGDAIQQSFYDMQAR